ncbi:MAG: hypothetical protein JST04_03265 [Bdellovibrionales bacterium]|nr:hypothetical protein [Bdellovibrionales bacterium]
MRQSFRVSVALLSSFLISLSIANASEEFAKVRISGNTIVIRVDIDIYGEGATRTRAEAIRTSILRYWAKRPKDGMTWTYFDSTDSRTYDVVFEVQVSLLGGRERQERNVVSSSWATPISDRNSIRTPAENTDSYVSGGNHGVWSPNYPGTYAHEFGHLLGLDDHYTVGTDGYSHAKPGYETNIMANTVSGRVEQINIDPIAGRIVSEFRRARANPDANLGVEFQTTIDIRNPTD